MSPPQGARRSAVDGYGAVPSPENEHDALPRTAPNWNNPRSRFAVWSPDATDATDEEIADGLLAAREELGEEEAGTPGSVELNPPADGRAVGKRLDPAVGLPDDSQERNWNGQTRGEFLEMMQEAHEKGNVLMEDDTWMVEDDAETDVGVDEVARLRDRTEKWLAMAWALLEGRNEGDRGA